jgi:hypothetical protein
VDARAPRLARGPFRRVGARWLVVVGLAACGGTEPRASSSEGTRAAVDSWVTEERGVGEASARDDGASPGRPGGVRLLGSSRTPQPLEKTGTIVVKAPPEAPVTMGPQAAPNPGALRAPARPRLGRVRRVDVRFQGADIHQALHFLAEAGRFNVVVESTLSGQVSARLRDVDPYDALLAVAEANGAVARWERNVVIVRRR